MRTRMSVKRVLSLAALLALVALLAVPTSGTADDQAVQKLLQQADQYYQWKSWNRAWRAYREILRKYPKNSHLDKIHYRMASIQMNRNNPYYTIRILQNHLSKVKGDKWKAEYQFLIGKAMVKRNRQDRRKVTYLKQSLQYFEANKYPSDRITDNLFQLARSYATRWQYTAHQSQYNKEYKGKKNPPSYGEWRRDIYLATDKMRKKKVIEYYQRIIKDNGSTSEPAAKARLELACFYINHLNNPEGGSSLYPKQKYEFTKLGKEFHQTFVKNIEKGLDLLRAIGRHNPSSSVADQAAFLIPHTYHVRTFDLAKALQGYKKFIANHRSSSFYGNAYRQAQKIEMEELAVSNLRTFRPGTKPQVYLKVRNVPVIQFDAYSLELDNALVTPKSYIQQDAIEYVKQNSPTPYKSWKHKTGLEGKFTGWRKQVVLPITKTGAYLVRARGKKITSYFLLVISDLALTTTAGKNKILTFVTDLKTHKPVGGTKVALKISDGHRTYKVLQGTTDSSGVAEFDITNHWDINRYRRNSNRMRFLAVGRKDAHHAVTNATYHYKRSWNRGNYRVYPVTDRPLYKPSETVNFKIHIRKFVRETYQNFNRQQVKVVVKSPRGEEVYKKHLQTTDNGWVADSFKLKKKAHLGMYQIYTYIKGSWTHRFNNQYQRGRFQVEEYKQPEYIVKVNAPTGQIFPGQKIEAKVSAKYYYGAPLRLAKVHYEVYRTSYNWTKPAPFYPHHVGRPSARRSSYRYRRYRRYRPYRRPTPTVKVTSGKGSTDENGEFAVNFKTVDKKQANTKYTIKVRVIDKSRRSIRAQGQVLVTTKGFSTTVKPAQHLVKIGEKIKLNLSAKTASKSPVATSGVVEVHLQGKDKGKLQFVKWKHLKVRTGKDGQGTVSFRPLEEGYYKLVFATADDMDNRITSEGYVWVVGKNYQGRNYNFSNVQLIPNKKSYESDEIAKFLLNSPVPAVSAFIVVSSDQFIFDYKVVETTGESKVFSLPLQFAYAPNVFVTCTILTRKGRFLQGRSEIKVLPHTQNLQVKLRPTQKDYSPGSKAEFAVEVTDHQGNPVSTDACISVVDTSLFYIQPEIVKEIRNHFYKYQRNYQLKWVHSLNYRTNSTVKWELGWKPRHPRQRGRISKLFRYQHYYRYYGFNRDRSKWRRAVKKPQPNKRDERKGDGSGSSADPADREGLGRPSEDRARRELSPTSPSAPGAANSRSRRAPMKKSKEAPDRSSGFAGKGSAGPRQQGQSKPAQPKFKKARVRSNFSNLAYWNHMVKTDQSGKAKVTFTLPDNLTQWKATVRAITRDTKLGQASTKIRTRKLILVRLQGPRFYQEKDKVVISGVIHNYLKKEKKIKAVLKLHGDCLALADGKSKGKTTHEKIITLSPKKDYRMDWVVKVVKPGTVKVEMQALSDTESDGMAKTFPVFPYGFEKFVGQSSTMVGPGGKPAKAGSAVHTFRVPKERTIPTTELRVVVSPSIAGVMLESLPYLAKYPYGCVEQTMSRFLPSVLVKGSLEKSGMDLSKLAPKGGRTVRTGTFGKAKFQKATVLSKGELNRMVQAGLARLYSFQHSDGGWGWWKNDSTNKYMTAYVLYGLIHAQKAGIKIDSFVITGGTQYLMSQLLKVDIGRLNPKVPKPIYKYRRQRLAYMAYVLSEYIRLIDSKYQKGEYTALVKEIGDYPEELTPYSLSLITLAHHNLGLKKKAKELLATLNKQAQVDEKNGTHHWGGQRYWYRWYSDPTEATAFGLRAHLAIDPTSKNITRMVKWLIQKRKRTYWHSTKATATAIFALTEYLDQARELEAKFEVAVKINGREVQTIQVTRDSIFQETAIVLRGDAVESGKLNVEVVKKGGGNLYYSVLLKYFSKEEKITAGGHKISVKRKYFLVTKKEVEKNGKKVDVEEKKELPFGAVLKSDDLIEVVLEIDSPENFEYVAIEDRKPAGFEAVRLTSGRGPGIASFMEMRTEMVALFATRLPKGKSRLSYRFRAEIPGVFYGMPARAYCMYTPHVKANSDSFKVEIRDE